LLVCIYLINFGYSAIWLAILNCYALLAYWLLVICAWFGWPISLLYQYLSVSQVVFSPLPQRCWLQTLCFHLFALLFLFSMMPKGGRLGWPCLFCLDLRRELTFLKLLFDFVCFCVTYVLGPSKWLISYEWSIWSFSLSSSKRGNLLTPSLCNKRFWW